MSEQSESPERSERSEQSEQSEVPDGPLPPPDGGAPPPRNGAGFAALVLGVFGSVLGPIPFWGIIGLGLGVLALSFGLVGRGRQRLGVATNGGMATLGAVLGVIAIGLGTWSLFVLNDAYNKLKG